MDRLTSNQIRAQIFGLTEKYPTVARIEITYYGSGDSFDSYDVEGVGKDDSYQTVEGDDIEPIFWELIERADSDFNNDGSQGTVTIDLVAGSARIQDYAIITDTKLNEDITV